MGRRFCAKEFHRVLGTTNLALNYAEQAASDRAGTYFRAEKGKFLRLQLQPEYVFYRNQDYYRPLRDKLKPFIGETAFALSVFFGPTPDNIGSNHALIQPLIIKEGNPLCFLESSEYAIGLTGCGLDRLQEVTEVTAASEIRDKPNLIFDPRKVK